MEVYNHQYFENISGNFEKIDDVSIFSAKTAKIRRLYGKTDQNDKTCNFSKFHPILMIYPSNESSGIEFSLGYKRI